MADNYVKCLEDLPTYCKMLKAVMDETSITCLIPCQHNPVDDSQARHICCYLCSGEGCEWKREASEKLIFISKMVKNALPKETKYSGCNDVEK